MPAQPIPRPPLSSSRSGRLAAALASLVVICLVVACAPTGPEPGAAPVQATIRIHASERLNAVSDLLYGQFAEFMFENIKHGMWAELLANRGFEDPAPPPAAAHYWERYPDNRNHANGFFMNGTVAGVSEQGYPSSYANRAQVLVNSLPEQMGHGIYQENVPVRSAVSYRGSVWLKASGVERMEDGLEAGGAFDGSLRVSLEENRSGGTVYASKDLGPVPNEWTRFTFDLPVERSDPLARFALRVFGVGVVWIDQPSLMPGDAVNGIRADVLEKIEALQPAFVRWPGGNVAQDYHWEWGVGPLDERPVWVNMSWDNDPEPSDFGTLEYLRFCETVGAEPNIVVNADGRGATVGEAAALRAAGLDIRDHSRRATPQEAANWVEYVNGDSSTQFGSLRERHGRSEPFGVVYWEIGNEIWGDWVRGHSDAATYAATARRYIRAMKAVDPSIRIIAVGDEDPEWNRTVLKEIGGEIDFLAIHHYRPKVDDPPGFPALMARPLRYERLYGAIREMIREIVPGREVGVALNEWNTTFGIPRQHTMESALYGARLMNVFERQGDLIRMSAVSDLVNGWPGGVIQASRHDVFTTATYSVIEAYVRNRGGWRVKADVECDLTYDTGDAALGAEVPALDVSVTAADSGSALYIKAVNTSAERSIRAVIEVQGVSGELKRNAAVTEVTAPSLETANSFRDPHAIAARESTVPIEGPRFEHTFPRHSVTVLRIDALPAERSGSGR